MLAVLSFMPILSQAAGCLPPSGPTVAQEPKITPFPGGWKVTAQYLLTFTQPDCSVMPNQLFQGGATSFSRNGVSVNIRDAQIFLKNVPRCFNSAQGQNTQQYKCEALPQTALVEVQYTLTGKSTTTDPNIPLFSLHLAITAANLPGQPWGSQIFSINVPATTAPTCSFLIDPPNITLEPIKLSDIASLNAGAALEASQKKFNLTVNCAALSASATFAPQFSPTKSAILAPSSHVALNDGTDNGVGFKLFDPSNAAIAFKTPLASEQNKFTFTPTLGTVTKAYTIKYTKTSTAVKAGPVTSSITITFSIL